MRKQQNRPDADPADCLRGAVGLFLGVTSKEVRLSINLSTFNIFWYRGSETAKNPRSEADQKRIARVLARLDAHALVLQEILDHGRLESLLRAIEGTTTSSVSSQAAHG